jgi:DNA polymerase V
VIFFGLPKIFCKPSPLAQNAAIKEAYFCLRKNRFFAKFATMNELEINSIEQDPISLQFFDSQIQAGFPSPAQGSFGDTIDLNDELISNPEATFCARVIGNSMIDSGINEGDLLLIDRSLTPHDGCIAVCFIDGEFTVKRVSIRTDGIYLVPANKRFPELHVNSDNNFQIWGVVSHIIKKL